MIRPEQLAQALDRIPPRDRELLSLSLRRRVPDEALGRLYDAAPPEVARMRARAIERLADEMELQRGEDLGAVLKALLEPDTWSATAPGLGEEFAAGASPGPAAARLTAVPAPVEAVAPAGEGNGGGARSAEAPEREEPQRAEPKPSAPAELRRGEPAEPEPTPPAGQGPTAQTGAPAASGTEPAQPEPKAAPVQPEPVLEMLAAREKEVPDPPRRAVPLALFGIGVAALLGAAALIGATQFGDSGGTIQPGGGDEGNGTRDFVPAQGGPLAAPFASDPQTLACYSTAYVRGATTLYREPGGRRRIRLTRRTEWGSPRVLGVVKQRGGWLGVQAPELRNGEIAWLRKAEARVDCVRWSLHADLSKRVLTVREDGRTVRRMNVAIGRPENPTPKGRFTVTDKLRVTDGGSPYGCCVLALTGHQTDLPPYWPGGDRLAVHATSDRSSIGKPVSLGCLRARSGQVRWLIETIPLGAPVFIRV